MEYQWNHANLLTAVIYKTSNNVVTKSVAYQYDALGRRIGKSVDDNGNGTVDRRESYIYDGAGLLSSFSPTGGEGGRRPDEGASAIQISGPNGSLGQHGWTDQMVLSFVDADGDGSGTAQLSGRYLYGPAVDEIFAVENGTGDVLWALTDQLGTPRDWAQRTSSGNTLIAQHIRYTAFGAIDSITDGAGNPLATSSSLLTSFTGQLNDPDAGLIYYRARWYDPQLGKFISDDPMGFEAGDANVSRYVGNGSTDSLDFTGLQDAPNRPPVIRIRNGIPWIDTPTVSVKIRPVIVFVFVENDPSITNVDTSRTHLIGRHDLKYKLREIEEQLNKNVASQGLPHIHFRVSETTFPKSQTSEPSPRLETDTMVRYDFHVRLTQSTHDANSQNPISNYNNHGMTLDESAVFGKQKSVDSNTIKWPVIISNAILHEFFTFDIFGDDRDIDNRTNLTAQHNGSDRPLTITPGEQWSILSLTDPMVPRIP